MMHIAFVGPMRSGKTTAANYLVEKHGYTRIALADPLKEATMWALNEFINHNLGYLKDRQDGLASGIPILLDAQEMTDRKDLFRPLWQWWGTDFRDYLQAPNLWVDMFLAKLPHVLGPVVCDDVRFPHEADALRNVGFRLVRIIRPEEDRLATIEPRATLGVLRHSSELQSESIKTDYRVWNDGSLDDLAADLDAHSGTYPFRDTGRPLTSALYAGRGDDSTGHDDVSR